MVARWVIVVLASIFLLLVGANLAWHLSFAAQIVPVRSGDNPEIVAYRLDVERAYETGDIDAMEAMGNRLRADESRVTGGNSKLFEFYSVLDDINCQCRDGDRKVHSFEDRQRRLQEWLDRYPQSITATVAMAYLWEYRAWQQVGGYAYATTPTAAQQQAFRDALAKAHSYIARLQIRDDPYVAFALMRMQLDEGANRDDLDRLFAESTAAWPRHYQIYFLYSNLLVRLFNDQAAQVKLMRDLAAAKDDPDKQVGLAYILGVSWGWWSPADLPWADVQHAYMVRNQRYGWRNRDWNAMCRLSMRAADWVSAKYCFEQINGHWDDEIWQGQNEFVWNELVASLH